MTEVTDLVQIVEILGTAQSHIIWPLFFIIGLFRGWWLMGTTHREIVHIWKSLVRESSGQTGKALGVIERIRS